VIVYLFWTLNSREKNYMEKTAINGNLNTRGLLTISQVSEKLQLKKQTIYALIWKGKIPCVKLSRRCVRFLPAAIDDWVARKSFEAVTAAEPPQSPPRKKKSATGNNITVAKVNIDSLVARAKKEILKK